ncbi:MAG: DUF4249 domain-containing protein [Allomuricauda sp.]
MIIVAITKILVMTTLFGLTSCEDVIDLEVPTETAHLVIEASIDWEKGTSGNEQTIKLSMSKPYFDPNGTTPVTGASVKVTYDADGTEFIFEDQNNGTYTTDNFLPALNHTYTLEVTYDGETYIAHEMLMPVPSIHEVDQSVEGGFDDELLDVNVYFYDPVSETNFYLIKFKEQDDMFPTLFDLKDEFTNGNLMTTFYEKFDDEESDEEAFVPGDIVDIALYGISQQYYNYLHLMIEQEEYGGGPFSSTPVAIKGNCINQTNPSNYALGYFRLTEVVKTTYIFQ